MASIRGVYQDMEPAETAHLRSNRSRQVIDNILRTKKPLFDLRKSIRFLLAGIPLDITEFQRQVENRTGFRSYTFNNLMSGAYKPTPENLVKVLKTFYELVVEHDADVDLRPTEFHMMVLDQRRRWLERQLEHLEADSLARRIAAQRQLSRAYEEFCKHLSKDPPKGFNDQMESGGLVV